MIPPSRLIAAALGMAVLLLTFPSSRGNTFDWPTSPAFPTGPTPGNSTTMLYAGLGAVTLTNNKDPGTGTGGVWQAGYPAVDNTTTTGGPNARSRRKRAATMLASQPTVNSNIKFSMTFGWSGGARNVSLVIWDVDAAANFTDKLANIVGITTTGTQVFATVTGSASGQHRDRLRHSDHDGHRHRQFQQHWSRFESDGNVTISFGAAAIQSVEFIWSDADATTRTTQVIGISPIIFTPVGSVTPEVGSSFAALIVCIGVIGCGRMARRRKGVAQV